MKVFGHKLSRNEQEEVLRKFPYRFTGDHRPFWADIPNKDGSMPIPTYENDQEWLRHTEFEVRKDGKLSRKHKYCTSHIPSNRTGVNQSYNRG